MFSLGEATIIKVKTRHTLQEWSLTLCIFFFPSHSFPPLLSPPLRKQNLNQSQNSLQPLILAHLLYYVLNSSNLPPCSHHHPSKSNTPHPTDMRRDVQEIFKATPHHKQVMMFSATLSKEIRPTCKKFMQSVCPVVHVFTLTI